MNILFNRLAAKCRRTLSDRCYRRLIAVKTNVPLISFSFDDAPRTAFRRGGDIVKACGGRATFYVSLGRLGQESPSGTIASAEDLELAVQNGHELGCHTFDHRDSWKTPVHAFEQSVLRNRQALAGLLPQLEFATFAYPLCGPRPSTKHRIGMLFKCCRGGGQTLNAGRADLNLLKAFFLDHRNRNDFDSAKRMIDINQERCGWLIFASHDVAENPSPYGCSIEYFEKTVAYAVNSGASIKTVRQALQQIDSHRNI
jgi:hypothetical protein